MVNHEGNQNENLQVKAGADRLNVVLILSDDQGYSDVGFDGNPKIKTPVLDRLASESAVFENFYACPVCAPTRASLLTGRYNFRTGVTQTQEGMAILRPSETTIAETLKSAGYRTGMFGKWHLGDNAPSRPCDLGFERFLTHAGGMIGLTYNPMDGNAYFNPVLIEDGREKRFNGYCTDVFFDEAIKFIGGAGDKPFFLYLAPNAPHHPLTAPDRYVEPYQESGLSEETSRFYGMITNMDDNIGRLMDALEESGKADDTVIIFAGDNGTSSLLKEPDLWEAGLRGRKTQVYENGVRVPMFIRVPGAAANGKRLATPGSVNDIMPTVLSACNVPAPKSVAFDGASLLPLLTTPGKWWDDRFFFFQFHPGVPSPYRYFAVRQGYFKLVQPVGCGNGEFTPNDAKFELYNLDQDPFEKRDIAEQQPEVVARLKAEYRKWFDDVCSQGFDPVPIEVGGRENPVALTRQDWHGAGLFDGDPGTFILDIKTPGTYRITCRWNDIVKQTYPCTVELGDQVLTKNILYAETEIRFDEVKLEKGICEMKAWVTMHSKNYGFRFFELEQK